MTKKFAKIFESEKMGQILVVIGTSDDDYKPAVKVSFNHATLELATTVLKFEDTAEGWNTRDNAFEKINLEMAEAIVGKALSNMEGVACTK